MIIRVTTSFDFDLLTSTNSMDGFQDVDYLTLGSRKSKIVPEEEGFDGGRSEFRSVRPTVKT